MSETAERKDQLRLMEEKLAECQRDAERFHRVAKVTTDGWALVEGGSIVLVNQRCVEIFGYDAEEIKTKSGFDFAAPEEQARLRQALAEARSTQTPPKEFRFWIVGGDGERRYVRNRYLPIVEEGQLVGRLIVTTDLTQSKLMEEELARHRDHLEELVEERTASLDRTHKTLLEVSRRAGRAEVATDILHNAGNALNSASVIAGQAYGELSQSRLTKLDATVKLIQQHSDDLPNFLQHDTKGRLLPTYLDKLNSTLQEERQNLLSILQELQSSIQRLETIVRSHEDSAQPDVVLESCFVADLFDDAVKLTRPALQRCEAKVVLEHNNLPLMQLDRYALLQVLVNLLGNAAEAVSSAELREIYLRASCPEPKRLLIEVEDTGVGVSEEARKRLFQQGFSSWGGLGIGLHRSWNTTRLLGGQLKLKKSDRKAGACFLLELPIG